MTDTDLIELTAALIAAIEPVLVAECLAILERLVYNVDPAGGAFFLEDLKAELEPASVDALTQSVPLLGAPLSMAKGEISLVDLAILLSAGNWTEEAASEYLEVLRLVIAATKRVSSRLPNDTSGRTHDYLQRGVVVSESSTLIPLQFAVVHSHPSVRPGVVKALLNTGAYTWGDERCTLIEPVKVVLFDAVRIACADTLRLLLDAGFDAKGSVAYYNDITLLHALACVEVQDCAEKLQLLLAAGADIEARDRDGLTPLQIAVLGGGGSHAAFDSLLAAGADPSSLGAGNGPPGGPWSCLRVATAKGDVGLIRRLLDTTRVPRGIIDPNERDFKYARTALEQAVVLDNPKTVEALIAGGADHSLGHAVPKLVAGTITPLDVAIWAGSYRAYKALVTAGAQSRLKGQEIGQSARSRLTALSRLSAMRDVLSCVRALSNDSVTRTPQQIREGARKILEHLQR